MQTILVEFLNGFSDFLLHFCQDIFKLASVSISCLYCIVFSMEVDVYLVGYVVIEMLLDV